MGWQLYLFIRYLIWENFLMKLSLFLWGPVERDEEDVKDRVVVITGANTGIGKATAMAMAARGAVVVLACRNLTQGTFAYEEIQEKTLSTKLHLMRLDLADLNSIKSFADSVKSKFPKIHILINNAGFYQPAKVLTKTKDNFETHFGVNHLGHFLLTNLLLENLKRGAPSRIVAVSSLNQMLSDLDFNDLMLNSNDLGILETMPYNNSKYANSLFMNELGRRLGGTGVTTYSLCPGHVMTDIFRYLPWHVKFSTYFSKILMGLSPEMGSEAVLFCALSKKFAYESGYFYHFYERFEPANRRLSPEIAAKLWNVSEKLVKLDKHLKT